MKKIAAFLLIVFNGTIVGHQVTITNSARCPVTVIISLENSIEKRYSLHPNYGKTFNTHRKIKKISWVCGFTEDSYLSGGSCKKKHQLNENHFFQIEDLEEVGVSYPPYHAPTMPCYFTALQCKKHINDKWSTLYEESR